MAAECNSFADVERLLQEIKERVETVESFLQASLVEEANLNSVSSDITGGKHEKKEPSKVLRKTKYGKFVESATEKWLRDLLKKRPRVLYVETVFRTTCCLCQTEKYCLTAKTVKSGGKRYTIPLCDNCANALAKNPGHGMLIQNSHQPRARIYYNAVETKRRKY